MSNTTDSTTSPTKICTVCKAILPATSEFFYPQKARKNTTRKNGLKSACKKCELAYHKAKHAIPTPRQSDRITLTSQGMKRCTTCKTVFLATTDYFHAEKRTWDKLHTKCKICERAYSSEYRRTHKEQIKRLTARYIANHKESIAENKRRWIHKNPSKARAWTRRRRAIKKGVETSSVAFDEKAQMKRQKGRCYYCGNVLVKYDVEHIIPLSRGGSDTPDNKVLACPSCNRSKCNKLPHEWSKGGRLL